MVTVTVNTATLAALQERLRTTADDMKYGAISTHLLSQRLQHLANELDTLMAQSSARQTLLTEIADAVDAYGRVAMFLDESSIAALRGMLS